MSPARDLHRAGEAPSLVGEGAKDMIFCRFDASIDAMKLEMARSARIRRDNYGLPTGRLYLSERGRKVVHVQEPVDNKDETKELIPCQNVIAMRCAR